MSADIKNDIFAHIEKCPWYRQVNRQWENSTYNTILFVSVHVCMYMYTCISCLCYYIHKCIYNLTGFNIHASIKVKRNYFVMVRLVFFTTSFFILFCISRFTFAWVYYYYIQEKLAYKTYFKSNICVETVVLLQGNWSNATEQQAQGRLYEFSTVGEIRSGF